MNKLLAKLLLLLFAFPLYLYAQMVDSSAVSRVPDCRVGKQCLP
ncbi:hypothetical protein [Bacteroides reticulotermitis]|uniref:Uncharacterized protein n=1 Tax=Bacteroides reticulotermitis TaxID=1133319 RepID=A0A840DB98_9BACE|nr:hypothetical protein [Bacteroides reticulotermitis]MBB4045915.1 hypothetical protein [Bacteroides reticulotermitis]